MGNVHTERWIFTPGLNEDRCEGECGWRSCEHSVGATAPGIGDTLLVSPRTRPAG